MHFFHNDYEILIGSLDSYVKMLQLIMYYHKFLLRKDLIIKSHLIIN